MHSVANRGCMEINNITTLTALASAPSVTGVFDVLDLHVMLIGVFFFKSLLATVVR